jgi:4-amino-4-deoxy-L-arabinose transferase-like glycosyltransferase
VSSRALPKTAPKRRPRRAAPVGAPTAVARVGALRRIPAAGWLCALIACLNGVAWSVVSPPFQVVDESSHYAYVQRLAETGRLPSTAGENFPRAEATALYWLHNAAVLEHPYVRTISTEAGQRKLERELAVPAKRTGSTDGGVAASQPPLYYALETIPYDFATSGTVLDRLVLMRLLSTLFGGLTGLFGYLFLRELLPSTPWAWTVGGLAVAVEPLLGMISGSVNPDALLFADCAALFFCLARAFRRGLSRRLAAALGAVLAVGFLTKLTFLALLPGALLGLVALGLREVRRTSKAAALRSLAFALGIAASPSLLYVAVNLLSGRPAMGVLGNGISLAGNGSLTRELSYIWQFYLPRLPGMTPYFHGFLPLKIYWLRGVVGLYGWLDTAFPMWVYNLALIPAAVIAALTLRALFLARGVLRSRAVEFGVYAVMALGLLLTIGADDFINKQPGEYAEPRYLLPLVALWGAVAALAARGAGRRWGPVAGALIVTLALAHSIFGQLLDIARYYG